MGGWRIDRMLGQFFHECQGVGGAGGLRAGI